MESDGGIQSDAIEIVHRSLQQFTSAFEKDELAYLALTSKPEFVVRDHIAWKLHQQLPDPRTSAREWRPSGRSESWRADLAVLDIGEEETRPELLLEVKSCYSFDAIKSEKARERFPIKAVSDDIDKSFAYAEEDTAVLALLIVVHPRSSIDTRMLPAIKYGSHINSCLRKSGEREVEKQATEFLNHRLPKLAPIIGHGKLASGTAFNIPTDMYYWLLGPAKQWS